MAAYSSSAMSYVNTARIYGSNFAYVCYTGLFSASTSDEIQMLRLPRNAVIEQLFVGGNVAATVASLNVGDDAGSKARYGIASLSNASAQSPYVNNVAVGYHYSLSDDDPEVTILLTSAGNTSASGSCSIHMGVWYHMPDGR